jgi:hypothetical protein
LLTKFDSSGGFEWARAIGGPDYEQGTSVAQTSDGGYAICGLTDSYGAGQDDGFVTKFDASGSHQWTRAMGASGYDDALAVVATDDGGCVVTGEHLQDVLLAEFDASGNLQWARRLGGGSLDWGWSLINTRDGGYALVGRTYSYGAGSADCFFMKFDDAGECCIGEAATPTVTPVLPSVENVTPTIQMIPFISGDTLPFVVSRSPTITPLCVEGSPILGCSLWVEPGTPGFDGRGDIELSMWVQNRGGTGVDSTLPRVDVLGDVDVVLESGPIPAYADLGPGQDAVFKWVFSADSAGIAHWIGYALGKDEDSGDPAASYAATSELVETGGPSVIFLRSDADADMDVEMSDAIFTLKHLYVPGSPEPPCMDGADSDDGGAVEMSDAIYTLKYLYVPGSPAPPAPGPNECGADPTEDDLDCVDHPCMGP